MARPKRLVFMLIAMLMGFGGLFGSLGVVAQDGGAPQVAQPGGDLPGDPSVELVQVAGGLVDPINVAAPYDGSGRLFVVERVGTIRIIENGEVLEEPFLDISNEVKIDFLEQGLLGLAFHPEYADNGRFFVFYSDYRTNGDHFIVEYNVSDDPNVADPESGRVVLTVDDPFINHNGGTILFGPDGYLYITLGDGGMAGDPYDEAQDLSTLLGKILRIDVDVDPNVAPYGIPADNPFADAGVWQSGTANPVAQTGDYRPDARAEIYMYGLRNAWQFSFDRETGDMYIADVGQVAWEEINFKAADEPGGQNYGWDLMEASHCYPPDPDENCDQFGVMPVAEYAHDDVGGCSITGIGVYRGGEQTDLDGIYFSSDFCTGRIWGLQQDEAGTWQFEELLDTELAVTGSGSDENGELYLTSCSCMFGRDYDPYADPQGAVWQVVSSDNVPEGATTAPLAEGAEDAVVEEDREDEEASPEASPTT